jgi:DNA phosphorothioation-associated putative methyltransferase
MPFGLTSERIVLDGKLPFGQRAKKIMSSAGMPAEILRYRTAITRVSLARPLRLAIEVGLIEKNTRVLDYGCGRGDDLRELQAQGIQCYGWDPIYRPEGERTEADIVNLGYVVNVIEDKPERSQTLLETWKLAQKVLIVAARLSVEARGERQRQLNDGYLTQKGTFQKFFTQQELRDWIDTTLGVSSVASAPGIFFVFRNESLRQSYLASRHRRKASIPTQHRRSSLFERYQGLLQPLINFFASRGRLPDDAELEDVMTLREVFGSVRRAFDVVQSATGRERWIAIQKERAQDLLVYLALQRFSERPRFSVLPYDLQLDVKTFFGTYTRACNAADQLLFSAGDMTAVDAACQEAACGKLTPEALYVHTMGLPTLPSILRIYEGCARGYIGAVEGANIAKLNRRVPQISYLFYPDFENDPHPALAGSLVVHLRTFQVRYFDYSTSDSPPILHRKETFVPVDHPLRGKFERLTRQEERRGLYENPSAIGTRQAWNKLLAEKGLRLAETWS